MTIQEKLEKRFKDENRKSKLKCLKEWINRNAYKIWRIILFPIWIGICVKGKIDKRNYDNCKFTNEVADKFWKTYFPKWCEIEDGKLYFNTDWDILGFKGMSSKDKILTRLWKFSLIQYLVNEFEIDGYVKSKIMNHYAYNWIVFEKRGKEND